MGHRSRRRVLAWGAAGLTLALMAFCVGTSIWPFGYLGHDWTLNIRRGTVVYEWNIDPFWIFSQGWTADVGDEPTLAGCVPMWGSPWYPTWDSRRYLAVPLAPLLWLLVPATVLLFLKDRRRAAPGFCRCGYDLTGNISGRCPECGNTTVA